MLNRNPALRKLDELAWKDESDQATLSGTILKSSLCIFILIAGVILSTFFDPMVCYSLGFVAFCVGMITALCPRLAEYLALPYALLEGVLIGGLSFLIGRTYPGLPWLAAIATIVVFCCCLALYMMRIVRVSSTFTSVVVSGTVALALFYLLAMVLSMFGYGQITNMLNSTGTAGMVISALACFLAAANLFLDLKFIHQSFLNKMPKYCEWYGAFGLLVTLVWLYLEILRLLLLQQKK